MIQVMTPGRKRMGQIYPPTPTEYAVDVKPGRSIQIYRNGTACRSFQVGDEAEYDSYNLNYTGTITAITDKAVSILKYGETRRLNIYEFCWRNWDFDAVKTAARNAEEMMYI
jgi:hypothetical protein